MKLHELQINEIATFLLQKLRPGDWIWPTNANAKPGTSSARKVTENDWKNHKIVYMNPDDSKGTCSYSEVGSAQTADLKSLK